MTPAVFLRNLVRLKTVDLSSEHNPLDRCLSTTDLTLLGISSMIGVTLYVLTGVVAHNAGPSVVLSYVMVSIAAMLSGLCYAELGSIFTKTGSAYLFTYCIIGELPAFIAGWSITLEYLLSAAVLARGWSGYLDSILDNRIQNFTQDVMMGGQQWTLSFIAGYPDIVAGLFLAIFTIIIALGARISAGLNKALLSLNLSIVTFITVSSFLFADVANWSERGFFPNGFQGTLTGAAVVFIGLVGYDVIAISSEEAKDPKKDTPRAIIISIVVGASIYILVSSSLTLAVPYYEIDLRGVLATPFSYHGLIWATYIVDAGALCAMSACELSIQFALPRMVYAMSLDGIFPTVFSRVNPSTKTPVLATLCFGFFAMLLAVLFNIEQLANAMSIGTLTAFSMVAASVVVLRYRVTPLTRHIPQEGHCDQDTDETDSDEASFLQPSNDDAIKGGQMKPQFEFLTVMASYNPGTIPCFCFLATTCLQYVLAVIAVNFYSNIQAGEWGILLLVIVLATCALVTIIPIPLHQQVETKSTFKAPLVPWIPMISILCNFALVSMLPAQTWIQFGFWIGIGLLIYFLYGYRHSIQSRAVKDVSIPKDQYSILQNSNERQIVLEGSLVMPQPAKKEKEQHLE